MLSWSETQHLRDAALELDSAPSPNNRRRWLAAHRWCGPLSSNRHDDVGGCCPHGTSEQHGQGHLDRIYSATHERRHSRRCSSRRRSSTGRWGASLALKIGAAGAVALWRDRLARVGASWPRRGLLALARPTPMAPLPGWPLGVGMAVSWNRRAAVHAQVR